MTLALFVASASAFDVEFCIEFQTDFSDVGGGQDYWDTNANRSGRGVWLSVLDNSSAVEAWPAHYVDDVTGCASVGLSLGETYTVRTYSEAEVNGIEARADNAAGNRASLIHDFSFSPTEGDQTLLLPYTDQRWVLLSVATYALSRAAPADWPTGRTLRLYHETSGGYWSGVGTVHNGTNSRFKHVMAHEIGHAIGSARDEESQPSFSYGAAGDGCATGTSPTGAQSHSRASKEFQSAAAVEGWAHFYSALLWNSTGDSDCVYVNHVTSDFDADGSVDNDAEFDDVPVTGYTSCEGIPVPDLESYVTARDLLEDLVNATDGASDGRECGGTLDNRGNEVDWLRFWWDMATDESVSFQELLNLYDDMGPRTWDADGGTGTTLDDPIVRLQYAAVATGGGVVTGWANQKDNGQDH